MRRKSVLTFSAHHAYSLRFLKLCRSFFFTLFVDVFTVEHKQQKEASSFKLHLINFRFRISRKLGGIKLVSRQRKCIKPNKKKKKAFLFHDCSFFLDLEFFLEKGHSGKISRQFCIFSFAVLGSEER